MAPSAMRSLPPSMAARPAPRASLLDDLPLYLPRVFYAFLGVVERKLAETGLARHLQPGMGHVLLRLYEGDNCIIKDISRSTHIANGTLTGLLKRMEQEGMAPGEVREAKGLLGRMLLSLHAAEAAMRPTPRPTSRSSTPARKTQ